MTVWAWILWGCAPGADGAVGTTTSASEDQTLSIAEPTETVPVAELPPTPPARGEIEVTFLGVGGVSLRRDDDLVLTAPLFTNPDLLTVTLGEIAPDPAVIEAFLDDRDVVGAQAILVGHAHYDHLLDVPHVQRLAGSEPTIFGNRSSAWLLDGVPELGPVVAANDPADPRVDRRMCSVPDPCTGAPAGQEGDWIPVPGAQVRVRALCATHPPQFLGVVHFGEGCMAEPQAAPPPSAADWLEGATLAWLVDFLDDDGAPVFRVFAQDAPTSAPQGLIHPDLLAERAVDLAVLNVGSFDAVRDHPTEALRNLDPRHALGVHWEDFFQTQAEPVAPLPFQADPAGFDQAAVDWLGPDRYRRPDPGERLVFPLHRDPAAERQLPDTLPPIAWTERGAEGLVLRVDRPAWASDCAGLGCADADRDGLVDAWEDRVLQQLRPVLTFDEAEPLLWDDTVLVAVGRVAPADDGGIRAWLALAYRDDYGRCGLTAHAGDSERVVLDLAPVDGGAPGDVAVIGLYTAAHEGTVTDHSLRLQGDDLDLAELVDHGGQPRWRVYASDGKHATYITAEMCEDAEWALCIEEDCAPDGVDDLAAHDRLPPVVNAGEPDAPRVGDLGPVGLPGEDPWALQDFCGGQAGGSGCAPSLSEKLLDDPFL